MREKQESKLALAERKIIIAGRMGENDARRGKPRKDFSMTNKSQEYVSSYNVGYDKIALQRIQTKKRQIPSSSLPVNLKRTKVDAVSVSTRATERGRAQGDEEEEVRHNLRSSSNHTGDLGQSIRNMPSHQRITIAARTITVAAHHGRQKAEVRSPR